MLRTLLCGSLLGSGAGTTVGALLWWSQRFALDTVLYAGGGVAVSLAVLWWTAAAIRAIRRRIRERQYRRRVREWRRAELEPQARRRIEDEITADLGPRTRVRPDPVWNRTRLAEAAEALGRSDFQAALAALTRLLERAPAHYEAWLTRGRIHGDLGDFDRAMSDLSRAEILSPYSPDPSIAMGEVSFARKDYVRAAGYYDVALMLDPKNAAVFDRRGLAHLHRSCLEMAVEDFRAALRLDPETPYVAAHLAQAEKKLQAATAPKKAHQARSPSYASPPRRW